MKETEQDLLFIPPASDRTFKAWKILEPIWIQAEEELQTAHNVIIIGYSLPAEDVTARKMLRNIAQCNPNIRPLIVDPYLNERHEYRYREIFANPLFLKATCKSLMGMLAALRTKRGTTLLKRLTPEVGSLLLDMVSPQSSRIGGALPGVLPLDTDLRECALKRHTSSKVKTTAINMLGLSEEPVIRKMLYRCALSERTDLYSRQQLARALGSVADQQSIQWLCRMLLDTRIIESRTTGLGLQLPSTVSNAAHAGIVDIAFSNPTLDFNHPIAIMHWLAYKGALMEHERFLNQSALHILQNVRILQNRYTFSDSFGINQSRLTNTAYRYREIPTKFDGTELKTMIKSMGFFDAHRNPHGKGTSHDYAAPFINGDWVVIDYQSNLMWALGTPNSWIIGCNVSGIDEALETMKTRGYAGYNDWRLPTLEEALSLLQPPISDPWCEDPMFLRRIDRIFTSDIDSFGSPYVVWLIGGYCNPTWTVDDGTAFIRAVRRLGM